MPIQPDLIRAHRFPEIRHAYTARDAILYALGAGLGRDPVAPDDLLFLWEEKLAVLPTFAVTLCTPGLWLRAPEFGVDFGKLVHAEQAATFHAPLPAAAETVGSARVALLADRGPGRGAVVALEREIRDAAKRRTLLRVAADVVPPRRRRVWRTAGAERCARSSPIANRMCAPNSPSIRARRSSTGSRATRIRCTSIRKPLGAAASIGRSCMAWRAMRSQASRYRAPVAFRRPASPPFNAVSPSVVFPGDVLAFKIWRGDGAAVFQGFVGDRKVLDQGLVSFRGDP